uniref:Uncharacterized protein n=1 Tax=Mycena chlorophos TaxID=658473 RepID=A0ABQ0L5B4_MYCCL|nr:predicted protein [Mycena chlorophos]
MRGAIARLVFQDFCHLHGRCSSSPTAWLCTTMLFPRRRQLAGEEAVAATHMWSNSGRSGASGQILPNATDFDINDSHFVYHQGDRFNVYHGPPPAIATLQPQADLKSEYEILFESLLPAKRGRPLLCPTQDSDHYTAEYQQTGISVGDVGSINTDGGFDYNFNLYQPADDPINGPNMVPPGFRPAHQPDITYRRAAFPVGSHVTSSTVEGRRVDHEQGPCLQFHCQGPSGALIALPLGSSLCQLLNIATLRRHLIDHAESWYFYLTETLGRDLPDDSFFVVTGCEKASAGGIATFQTSVDRQFTLNLACNHGDTLNKEFTFDG